jgi:alkylhydroperoxidase family enzyme
MSSRSKSRRSFGTPDLLTSHPDNVDDVDLNALGRHFSTDQVVELVATIATANWTNRMNDGLRTPIS